jgi:hypothetical protein
MSSRRGWLMLAYVACITAASITMFLIEGVGVPAALLLLILTLMLVVLFGWVVFDVRIRVNILALLGTWVLVMVCITVNFAGIYLDESHLQANAFSKKLDRIGAIEVYLDVTSAEARAGKAGIERGLGAFSGATSLAIIMGGIVVRLSAGKKMYNHSESVRGRARVSS